MRFEEFKWPIVVCVLADNAGYADDLFASCAICGEAIRHRPHVPSPHALVCLLCFLKHADPGDYVCVMPAESLNKFAMLAPDVPKC